MKQTFFFILALLLAPAFAFGQTAQEILASTDEAMLIGVVKKAERGDDTLYLINLACKRLGTHGTKEAVPALAAMLGDEKVAHYARYALETIPAPEVDAALREATKNLKGKLLAGVVNSLGVRRDAAAIPLVLPLLDNDDPEVVRSAYGCLGYIGTPESADALLKIRPVDPYKNFQADALFEAAQQFRAKGDLKQANRVYEAVFGMDFPRYQKNAALYWRIKTTAVDDLNAAIALMVGQVGADEALFAVAIKAARELPAGDAVTKAMIAELDKLPSERKALWIAALGDRIDDASKAVSVPAIGAQLASSDPAVKLAAIKALARIGNASVLPALIAATSEADETIAAAAKNTLVAIPGKAVDDAIVKLLETGDLNQKNAAIRLIEQRRIISAFDLLKKGLSNPGTYRASLDALGQVATLDDLPFLLDQLTVGKSADETAALQKVLMSACTRMPKNEAAEIVEKRFASASPEQAAFLVDLLKEIGGGKAVAAVVVHAWGENEILKDKATAALGSWRSPEDNDLIAEACLKLAKEAADNKYKLRGLRGYIRLPRQYGSIPEERKLQMVNQYMELAARKEDKLLVFDVFARNPSPKMLEAAVAYLADAELKDKAVETVIIVGEKIQGKSPATAAAVQKAADATANEGLKARAKVVIDKQK